MIVRLQYNELEGSKLVISGTKKACLMQIEVNEYNIEECIERFHKNKNIVSLFYTSTDISMLYSIDTKGMLVVVPYDVTEITEECLRGISDILNKLSKDVMLIVRLGEDYTNVRYLYELCSKYENISFCGGYLLRLKGLRLGCIGNAVTNKKTVLCTKQGCMEEIQCSCADDIVYLQDCDNVEFLQENKNKRKVIEKKAVIKDSKNITKINVDNIMVESKVEVEKVTQVEKISKQKVNKVSVGVMNKMTTLEEDFF